MPAMPIDVYPLVFGILAIALTAGAMELRASLRAPVCPRCIHCKHAALERRERDLRAQHALAKRLWGLRDEDIDDPDRRP